MDGKLQFLCSHIRFSRETIKRGRHGSCLTVSSYSVPSNQAEQEEKVDYLVQSRTKKLPVELSGPHKSEVRRISVHKIMYTVFHTTPN